MYICIPALRDMIVHAKDCSYMNITIVPPEDETNVKFYEVDTQYGSVICNLPPNGARSCANYVWRCASHFVYRGLVCYYTDNPLYTCGGKLTRGAWTPPSGMYISLHSESREHFESP